MENDNSKKILLVTVFFVAIAILIILVNSSQKQNYTTSYSYSSYTYSSNYATSSSKTSYTTSTSISNTPYASLTKSQKLEIIYWIEDRYEYYDDIEGRYCGDKYTSTIFNEAAKKYNKTYSQIDAIHAQSYYLKYE